MIGEGSTVINSPCFRTQFGCIEDATDIGFDPEKAKALLAEAGSDATRILQCTIWLADMADFDGFNAVWDAWVAPGETPTRCCGKVELADPAYRVEIVISALLP